MASLSVQGDPQGWADLGAAFGTAAATLESELSNADVNGAQALTRSWYGPTAAAFSASWAGRRSRYEQLINNLSSAGRAIGGYAQRLEELQGQAWSLESKAIEAGLRVTPLGDSFMIPPEIGLLPAPARMAIEHALNDVAQGVERLFADIAAAAEDLLFTLGPVATLLEEFFLAGVGGALLGGFLELGYQTEKYVGKEAKEYASGLGYEMRTGSTHDERSAASRLLVGAGRDANQADRIAKIGGRVSSAFGWGIVALSVIRDARHEGLGASLEQNAGGIASTAVAGVATDAAIALLVPAAPEALALVGGVAIGAVVAVGVGDVVQSVINHNQEKIDHALHDVESIF